MYLFFGRLGRIYITSTLRSGGRATSRSSGDSGAGAEVLARAAAAIEKRVGLGGRSTGLEGVGGRGVASIWSKLNISSKSNCLDNTAPGEGERDRNGDGDGARVDGDGGGEAAGWPTEGNALG
jgi:hypothetical protein